MQESFDVLLGSAHATLFVQAFVGNGWCVGPAAVAVALGWALIARGGRAALELVARIRSVPCARADEATPGSRPARGG